MRRCALCGGGLPEGAGACPNCGGPAERRGPALASAVIGAACGIGAAVLALVDAAVHGVLTWSRLSIASCALAWILVGLPLAAWKKRRAVIAAMFISLIAYLWYVERLGAPGTWFLSLGLPIASAATIAAAGTAYACARAKRKGPNIAAFFLVGGSALCVAVDLVVWLARGSSSVAGWSGIALASAIPVAILLLDIQKRVRGSRRVIEVLEAAQPSDPAANPSIK